MTEKVITNNSKSKVVQFIARIYLLAFLAFSIYKQHSIIDTGKALQIGFIAILIGWAIKHQKGFCFIPDMFLFSLPYFWTLSLYAPGTTFSTGQLVIFLATFAISLPFAISTKTLKNENINLGYGVWLAIVFVLLFGGLLRSVFPTFTGELYNNTLLNCILFFGGIPICIMSFDGIMATAEAG
jgi:hypothetical protein